MFIFFPVAEKDLPEGVNPQVDYPCYGLKNGLILRTYINHLDMNREEEIIKAAEETSKAMWDFIDDDYTIPFKHGAQWADSHPVNQWHKVEDDLPSQKEKSWLSDDVLAYIKNIGYISAYYNYQRKQWFDVEGNGLVNQTVLYWQPLPELPKEG